MNAASIRFPLVLLLASAPLLRAAEPAAASEPAFPLETYAAVGSQFAENSGLAVLGWTDQQFEAFVDGLRATVRGRPYAFDARARQLHDAIGRRLQQHMQEMEAARFTRPGEVEKYMKEAAKGLKLELTDSGLAYGLLTREGGTRPGPDDTVVLSYSVVAADAQTELPQLTASHRRVKVSELLPGLAEGVQMMALSAQALFVLPPDLSYGKGEWPAGVTPAPLIFTVKLEAISPGS